MSVFDNTEHFPKILFVEKIKNDYIVEMPHYQYIKVNFTENIWLVKNYVKCLLLSIKQLNKKVYFHGDIKPSNYLYLNPDKYVLIDFNASGKINVSGTNQKIATYPYIPPEVNKYCEINQKQNKKRDLWSVGIILLFFMSKSESIFDKVLGKNTEIIDQEEKSLFQYSTLYGVNKSKIKIEQKIRFSNFYFNPFFINSEYQRDKKEKENAINLIKQLLELDINKRINVENALQHDFFKNMDERNDNFDYYEKIITRNKLMKKYKMINELKICVICNKRKINESLKECEICCNFYHFQCIKGKMCTCKSEIPDYEFLKIINTCLHVNAYINKNHGSNIQIKLKLPTFSGKENSILNFLGGKTFSNELIYECDQSLNYYLMEYGIIEFNDENIKIYNNLKYHTKDGSYDYLKICKNDNQGYIVKATTFIEKNTLICEYIGDVFSFKDFCIKKIETDSNMDLIINQRSEASLIICPYKHSNIARFISGINNSDPNFKKLINVFSTRVSINGSVHVLLIASKDIAKVTSYITIITGKQIIIIQKILFIKRSK